MPYAEIPANILCCQIAKQQHPVTTRCLDTYAPEWYSRLLHPDNPAEMKYGMRDAIASFWRGEKDLIHIDHDMVFTWENLRDLVNCDSWFCTCAYMWDGTVVSAGLGFAKFSVELQQVMEIDLAAMSADVCDGCDGDWWGYEHHLMEEVRKYQDTPCVHGWVLNDHPMHGLRDEPDLRLDLDTEDGRAELVRHLREQGWSLTDEGS
jgi:hypothetical protein